MTGMDGTQRPGFAVTVLLGGLIAGVLDGLDAVIFYGITPGVTPKDIFQFIASGLIGRRSFDLGWHTILLGVCLHFLIACGAAGGYYVAARAIPAMLPRPWLCGTAYGLLFYAFMYRVVMPLSALPPRPAKIHWPAVIDEVFAHIVLVGVPIALLASRSARRGAGR